MITSLEDIINVAIDAAVKQDIIENKVTADIAHALHKLIHNHEVRPSCYFDLFRKVCGGAFDDTVFDRFRSEIVILVDEMRWLTGTSIYGQGKTK